MNGNSTMHKQIHTALLEIEKAHNCRVLFACESGSRAWGFPSPDSDYDIRFIYTHGVDWHLRINKQSDTLNKMLPGDLDLGGWELGKTLKLFSSGNVALYEWLHSPIVYHEPETLSTQLRHQIPAFFNVPKAFHHYLSLATKSADSHLEGNTIGIKKCSYIVRAIYASYWILECKNMPPTFFPDMLGRGLCDSELDVWIQEMIDRKRSEEERFEILLPEHVLKWIQSSLASLPSRGAELGPPRDRKALDDLNNLFKSTVLRNSEFG